MLPETLEHFREPAQDLIDERGAEDALAAAMAVISGATKIKSRSLLSNREVSEICVNVIKMFLCGMGFYNSQNWNILRLTTFQLLAYNRLGL